MDTYLEYARRGRNTWWRYLLTIMAALAITALVVVAVSAALVFGHLMPAEIATDLQKPTHPVVFFAGNGLSFAAIVAGFVVAMRLIQRKTVADVVGEWRWSRFAMGFIVWTACLVGLTLADAVIRPSGFRWTATAETPALAVAALFGLGVQTFAEEFVFRGYLTQGLLLATKRPLPAALLSGALFGALHIANGVPQCINATIFGVVAALIAIRTGGIAFTWGLHLINNLFGAVIVVSASDVFNGSPGLVTQTTPGLTWWDLALGLAALAVPVWLTMRRPRAAVVPASS